MLKYIISSHVNPNLSGVAKFNFILANKLDILCIGFEEALNLKSGPVLVSLKVRDLNGEDVNRLKNLQTYLFQNGIVFDLFFHTFDGIDVEYTLLNNCRKVFCGNSEINESIFRLKKSAITAWCPGLVDNYGIVTESKLNLFSFGMAHKIQAKYYQKLYEVLKERQSEYSLWVSTAFHEKANFGEFNLISTELNKIYGGNIQFLGFLSDDAVNYFLNKTRLFVAFFEKGVRANNTSVNAAMIRGCAVLTNCDEYSPQWMRHGENIFDIDKVKVEDFEEHKLRSIGRKAKMDVNKYASWEELTKLLKS